MSHDLQRYMARAVLGGETYERVGPRFAVHRNNVRAGLTEALATAFPAAKRALGDAAFNDIAGRFISALPPRAPQLAAYGSDLPSFMARQNVPPHISELARLEWARAECYFAADAPVLDARRLLSTDAHDIERITLKLHPATRWLTSAFPIFNLWQGDVADMDKPQSVLVTRKGYHIVTREISHADAAFVAALAGGATVKEAVMTAQITEDSLQSILQAHFINATFQDDGSV